MLETLFSPLMRDALVAGVLMASMFGLIGVFVVLRRVVFIGMTVAQVASSGTAFSFFIASLVPFLATKTWHHWGDIICSLAFTFFAVAVISRSSSRKSLPSEAVIGFAFAAFWALGIIFVANSGQGMAEVRNLIQGDLLLICTYHLIIIGAVSGLTWLLLLVFWKENILVSFDPPMARALGFRTELWDLAFYCLLGLTIVSGIRFAGLLLIFTYLVIPPTTGLLLAGSVKGTAFVSVITAILATIAGLAASLTWDLPASPIISLCCAILALAAAIIVKLMK